MASEEKKSRFRTITKEKKKKNFIINIFLFFFIVGYALFFTSNMWYPSDSNLTRPTPFHAEKEWNERKISLISWDYAKKQNLMEIQLEIDNASVDGVSSYSYEILDRNKGFFTVEPVLENSDFVVLHIKHLRSGWKELSLRIRMPGQEDDAENVLKFYTNVNEVNHVEQIETKTENEYYADRILIRIEQYEEIIHGLQDEITALEQQISNAEVRIEELLEKETYQTEQQRLETDEIINQSKSDIQLMKVDIEDKTSEIKEYEERIMMSEMELENYK